MPQGGPREISSSQFGAENAGLGVKLKYHKHNVKS